MVTLRKTHLLRVRNGVPLPTLRLPSSSPNGLSATHKFCGGARKFGYSRDKRPHCVQVVIALIVTPEGFPLAYEVMPGNTSDKTTLGDFLKRIEDQYGRAQRTWVMDRGIPTQETLEEMREAEQPVHYLVGTRKGQLSKLEKAFLKQPWEKVHEAVESSC